MPILEASEMITYYHTPTPLVDQQRFSTGLTAEGVRAHASSPKRNARNHSCILSIAESCVHRHEISHTPCLWPSTSYS
jgi:hypothetical protein